jgi:hypothetical protein
MGVKNDSTLVFNKYRVIFYPPLDGAGLKITLANTNMFTIFKLTVAINYTESFMKIN